MFVELSKLMDNCDFNISITKNKEQLTAIVIPKLKGESANLELKPMSMCGTPEQFDASFLNALSSAAEKVSVFVADLSAIDASIEKNKADKTEKATKATKVATKTTEAKAPVVEKPVVVKVDAKAEYEKGVALYNNAEYAKALPHLKLATETKPDNKTYKDKYDICQKWVDRLKESGLFKEEEVAECPSPVTDNKPSEQIFNVVSNEEDAVEVEEEEQFEGPGESEDNAEDEDDLQFSL